MDEIKHFQSFLRDHINVVPQTCWYRLQLGKWMPINCTDITKQLFAEFSFAQKRLTLSNYIGYNRFTTYTHSIIVNNIVIERYRSDVMFNLDDHIVEFDNYHSIWPQKSFRVQY